MLTIQHRTPCEKYGHRFEARYSLGQAIVPNFGDGWSGRDIAHIVETTKPRTYIYDICTRCGTTIKAQGT